LYPIIGESGDYVGNTVLQVDLDRIVPLWNDDNASNQKTYAANQ